jgi:RNA polymerase sigma-70 factor (ECF subfamily)
MQEAGRFEAIPGRGHERRLVARILDGEVAAGRELYDAHASRIYRLIFRLAGDEELASEFTQETFIRAFDRLGEFRGEASISTWLHSIAVSVTLNGIRRENRHRNRLLDISEAEGIGHTPVASDPDLRERLYRAIDSLDEIYRLAVVLHDIEGYTHVEIAAMLGIPEGTSKARLSIARSRLREVLVDFATDRTA